jgi:hypothetical protein
MMPPTSNVSIYVATLLPLLPICVLWLVGIVLALVMWKRHPGVSLVVLLACVLLLVTLIAGQIASTWVMQAQKDGGWSISQVGLVMAIVSWVRVTLSAIGYGLLLLAAFGWRGR